MAVVTIELDKVRDAAKTSPEARKALEVLCPEAFEVDRLEVTPELDARLTLALSGSRWAGRLERRNAGSLADKGWYLDPFTTWAIEEDDEGEQVLTASPKGER